MRPSSPPAWGYRQHFGVLLPGNPVFVPVCLRLLAGSAPSVHSAADNRLALSKERSPVLSRKLVSTGRPRVDYARVKLDGNTADPIAISGASVLSSTTRADGFVIIPADSEGLPAQSPVTVYHIKQS